MLITILKSNTSWVRSIFFNRFNKDIEFMIGHKPNIFWQATWRVVSPLIVLVIFLFYFVNKVSDKLTYIAWNPNSVCSISALISHTLPHFITLCKVRFHFCISSLSCLQANFPGMETLLYPSWVYVIIFILAGLPSLLIPGFALYKLFQRCCCKKNSYKSELNTVSAKIDVHDTPTVS